MSEPLTLALDDGAHLSALLDAPTRPAAAYVFAHGAGAGMAHPFMADVAALLCARGVAVLRFNFPFTEQGGKRPDTPAVAQAAVRAAVADAGRRLSGVPLFAGGKSFGGRMTSQAQAAAPLPGVRGLVFTGFPLHPAGKPSLDRAAHLAQVQVPMLFLQGTRDTLADLSLLGEALHPLRDRATLHVVDAADHGFDVLVRSGRTRAEVLQELADTTVAWMARG
jgi:predicted alpha/beta-hydrolase family hydrolase